MSPQTVTSPGKNTGVPPSLKLILAVTILLNVALMPAALILWAIYGWKVGLVTYACGQLAFGIIEIVGAAYVWKHRKQLAQAGRDVAEDAFGALGRTTQNLLDDPELDSLLEKHPFFRDETPGSSGSPGTRGQFNGM